MRRLRGDSHATVFGHQHIPQFGIVRALAGMLCDHRQPHDGAVVHDGSEEISPIVLTDIPLVDIIAHDVKHVLVHPFRSGVAIVLADPRLSQPLRMVGQVVVATVHGLIQVEQLAQVSTFPRPQFHPSVGHLATRATDAVVVHEAFPIAFLPCPLQTSLLTHADSCRIASIDLQQQSLVVLRTVEGEVRHFLQHDSSYPLPTSLGQQEHLEFATGRKDILEKGDTNAPHHLAIEDNGTEESGTIIVHIDIVANAPIGIIMGELPWLLMREIIVTAVVVIVEVDKGLLITEIPLAQLKHASIKLPTPFVTIPNVQRIEQTLWLQPFQSLYIIFFHSVFLYGVYV